MLNKPDRVKNEKLTDRNRFIPYGSLKIIFTYLQKRRGNNISLF